MSDTTNRQWLLAGRPQGNPGPEHFRWSEGPVPEPAEGQVLIRNLYLSCDPTQRGWMARDTYLPAVAIGEVMRSFAVGRIVKSRHPGYPVGQIVRGMFGWQDYAAVDAEPGPGAPMPLPPGVPAPTAMSALGFTGLTAYVGLTEIGKARAGETVVVSGAAGATGSVAGQIARIIGCRVVGIAGGADKCRMLTAELGFDAAIDYRSEKVEERLARLCPKGIDVFFDNVGGPALEAALANLARGARIVLCGAISQYCESEPPAGPRNYANLIIQRARMEGFIILDHMQRAPEAFGALAGWLREGKLKDRVDVVNGLENAPAALARLFTGANLGKQLVRVAE